MILVIIFYAFCFLIACPVMLACFYTDDNEITLAGLLISVFSSIFGPVSLFIATVMAVVTWGDKIVLFKKKG